MLHLFELKKCGLNAASVYREYIIITKASIKRQQAKPYGAQLGPDGCMNAARTKIRAQMHNLALALRVSLCLCPGCLRGANVPSRSQESPGPIHLLALSIAHTAVAKITRARGIWRYSSSFEQCGCFVYLDKRADLHRQTAIIHFPRRRTTTRTVLASACCVYIYMRASI
jgi:hypothetical protein